METLPQQSEIEIDALSPQEHISAGLKLDGHLEFTESNAVFNGILKGSAGSSALFIVGPEGILEGNLNAVGCEIQGKVNGVIQTEENIELSPGAYVTGTLQGGSLKTNPQSFFEGDIHISPEMQTPLHEKKSFLWERWIGK